MSARIKTDYEKAIHEAGHCVVVYALGGRLSENAKLSIIEDPENERGGVAVFEGEHKLDVAGIVGFAGCIAENIQSPSQRVEIRGKDCTDVLNDCSRAWDRPMGECLDCDMGWCSTHINRFADSYEALTTEGYEPTQEKKVVLDGHVSLLDALCNQNSKKVTLGPQATSKAESDFKVFARRADMARDILMKHWSVVVELAVWLDREKQIPNREVHDFLVKSAVAAPDNR